MNPDQIFGFICGIIVTTMIFITYAYLKDLRDRQINPSDMLCRHNDDPDDCPDCRRA